MQVLTKGLPCTEGADLDSGGLRRGSQQAPCFPILFSAHRACRPLPGSLSLPEVRTQIQPHPLD